MKISKKLKQNAEHQVQQPYSPGNLLNSDSFEMDNEEKQRPEIKRILSCGMDRKEWRLIGWFIFVGFV